MIVVSGTWHEGPACGVTSSVGMGWRRLVVMRMVKGHVILVIPVIMVVMQRALLGSEAILNGVHLQCRCSRLAPIKSSYIKAVNCVDRGTSSVEKKHYI